MRGMECTTEMPIQPNMSVVPTCLWVGSSRIALKFGFRLWPHIIFSPICPTHLDFREDLLGDANTWIVNERSTTGGGVFDRNNQSEDLFEEIQFTKFDDRFLVFSFVG